MTPLQREQLRDHLLSLLEELRTAERRGHDSTRTVELDQQAVGRLSRMDALQSQAMAQANSRQRDRQALRIQAALVRIADGTYGECLECGEPIPPKRLDLDPAAPLCISCASG
ncbi:MAG: TraR/DksA C4-type zinc finger protein [Pseudomonadota bacterium]